MDGAWHIKGSAALVLGSIFIAALVRFASVALVRIASIGFGFVGPGVNNRVCEDSRIE